MQSEYVMDFYRWFTKRFSQEVYRKMHVEHLAGLIEDTKTDLVLVLNRHRNVLEVESNYFMDGHAEFSLIEIGIRFERHQRGI